MRPPVHLFLALAVLAGTAGATGPPPGLTRWGDESYRLDPGEAATFRVDFDQIPVRRWVLLVESDRAPSHLNVRRVRDGSLLYDQRDEVRHEVAVPWGVDETASAVLTAGRRGGVFSVSIWGPPPGNYLRSYTYPVNRALEDVAAGRLDAARGHLEQAQRETPEDPAANVLLEALEAGVLPTLLGGDTGADDAGEATEPELAARVARARERVARLREDERPYEALEAVQLELGRPVGNDLRAELYGDLADVMLDLGNVTQARRAVVRATLLGLAPARVAALQERLDEES